MPGSRQRSPIWTIVYPGFLTKKNVDYGKIGEQIDRVLKSNFSGKRLLIRCVGSKDHKGKSTDELVKTIQEKGTDRYDPKRKMMFHEFYQKHRPHLFASPVQISKGTIGMGRILKEFYRKTKCDRDMGVRADIITVYDPKQLQMLSCVYEGQIESDCFRFTDPKDKKGALLGVICISSKKEVIKTEASKR